MFTRCYILASLMIASAAVASASDYEIVSLDGVAVVGEPRISFADGGAISGSTGCNRFQATGTIDNGDLVVTGPIAVTRMACPGDALTAQEDVVLAVLENRMHVRLNPFDGTVTISDGTSTLVLLEQKTPTNSSVYGRLPEPHFGRDAPAGDPPYLNPFGLSDELPFHAAPAASSEIVAGAFAGTVLRNGGCEGEWCAVEFPDGSSGGWAQKAFLEPSDSALRAGQGVFDATGPVPCAMETGTPMTDCPMGVARDGGGSATVVVTRPDRIERILFFVDGVFLGSDTSQAGGGFENSSTQEGDLTLIRVDDERYEIPDAVIFGG